MIWFGKDLWRSSPEGEVEKGEEKVYTKARVAGRDCKHKSVGHSDEGAGGERALRNSGKVIKSSRQI